MKFYLMRHGITDYNRSGLIQGCLSDVKLNEEGENQALSLKDVVKDLNIDYVYSGTLIRQIETARLVSGVEPNTMANFDEINFGEFDGMSCEKAFPLANKRLGTSLQGFFIDDTVTIADAFNKADTSGKSENSAEVALRFLRGIEILENYYHEDDLNILIVSSGMAIGSFFSKYCVNLSEYSMKNCSIHEIEKKDNKYFAKCIFKGIDRL